MDRIAIRLGTQAATPPPKELPTSDPISRRFSKDAVPDEVMFSNQAREASSYRDSPVP
jgi:hypothetical protein